MRPLLRLLACEDFHQILGVQPNATPEEIKKAYKKEALKWHPDRNRSPEAGARFKKIQEAYENLSQPAKAGSSSAFGNDQNSFFGGFEGGFPFGDGFWGEFPGASQVRCPLNFGKVYQGQPLNLEVPVPEGCPGCRGSGRLLHDCSDCQGSGFQRETHRYGSMITQRLTPCTACSSKVCPSCRGRGTTSSMIKIRLDAHQAVEALAQDSVLRFPGRGVHGQDLWVKLDVQDLQPFQILANGDLLFTHKIGLADALTGQAQVKVNLPTGPQTFCLNPNGLTRQPLRPGTLLDLGPHGLPKKGGRSRLLCEIQLDFPSQIGFNSGDELNKFRTHLGGGFTPDTQAKPMKICVSPKGSAAGPSGPSSNCSVM